MPKTVCQQSQINNSYYYSVIYPSYFTLQVRWLLSVTRITYLSRLIGIPSIAAFLQREV